jgi:hypothetical protein
MLTAGVAVHGPGSTRPVQAIMLTLSEELFQRLRIAIDENPSNPLGSQPTVEIQFSRQLLSTGKKEVLHKDVLNILFNRILIIHLR